MAPFAVGRIGDAERAHRARWKTRVERVARSESESVPLPAFTVSVRTFSMISEACARLLSTSDSMLVAASRLAANCWFIASAWVTSSAWAAPIGSSAGVRIRRPRLSLLLGLFHLRLVAQDGVKALLVYRTAADAHETLSCQPSCRMESNILLAMASTLAEAW